MPTRIRGLVLFLPALALIALVVILPAVEAVILALTTDDASFTIDNLARVFGGTVLGGAVRNTLVLLLVLLPVQAVIAVALAVVIGSLGRGSTLLRYLVLVPLAVSDLAAGLLWLAVLSDRGYLNSALQSAGLIAQPVSWLGFDSYGGMLAAIVVAETWRTTGVILLPIIDGAGRVHGPRDVIALLRSNLGPALLLRAILAVQTFAVVFALVGRNFPVIVGEAYSQLAANRNEHLAAACVVVILAVAAVTSAAYLRFSPVRAR